MPAVLESITSWNVRKMVFYVILSYLQSLQRASLESMDDVLSEPRFDSVECVAFCVTILPISGVVPPRQEEIWGSIRRRMRRVEGRGLLRLVQR